MNCSRGGRATLILPLGRFFGGSIDILAKGTALVINQKLRGKPFTYLRDENSSELAQNELLTEYVYSR